MSLQQWLFGIGSRSVAIPDACTTDMLLVMADIDGDIGIGDGRYRWADIRVLVRRCFVAEVV